MTEFTRPRIEDLADKLDIWKNLCGLHQAKGLDLGQLLDQWAKALETGLDQHGAKRDFDELREAGCLPKGLAALVLVLRCARAMERAWAEMVGDPSERVKTAASLEAADVTLEKLYSGVIESEAQLGTERLTNIGRIPISRLVSELRFHVRVITISSMLKSETEARSLEQVARYIVTAYVKQMSGEFHDRSVSGLIAEVLGNGEYNEVAHRMWRHRNYERLDKHYSWMANLLAVASVVVHHATSRSI